MCDLADDGVVEEQFGEHQRRLIPHVQPLGLCQQALLVARQLTGVPTLQHVPVENLQTILGEARVEQVPSDSQSGRWTQGRRGVTIPPPLIRVDPRTKHRSRASDYSDAATMSLMAEECILHFASEKLRS